MKKDSIEHVIKKTGSRAIITTIQHLVEGIQRFVPTLDGGDDLVGIGGPGEGLGLLILLGEEAVDGGLEVDYGMKDAEFEAALRQLGEEALDRVEP